MIAVIYIGPNRFRDFTRNNHETLFNELRSNWPIGVYDFTAHVIDRSSMNYQGTPDTQDVFDFYLGAVTTQAKFVIKLRTDAWFTAAANQVLIQEFSNIVNGDLDLCFVGMELSEDYATDYTRLVVDKTVKLQDSVVMANMSKINPVDVALPNLIDDRKAVSTNRAFRHLIAATTQVVTVHTQLPLVVDDYLDPDDKQITLAYINTYGERMPAARTYWTLRTPKT